MTGSRKFEELRKNFTSPLSLTACVPTTTPRFKEPAHTTGSPHLPYPHYIGAAAAFAANHAANACAFLVCIKTVPGPVNLHTNPSPDAIFDRIPPDATRSRTYLQFQATRCPLSMMYFSSFWSYATHQHTYLLRHQRTAIMKIVIVKTREDGNLHPS
jgi:hypothetical protein